MQSLCTHHHDRRHMFCTPGCAGNADSFQEEKIQSFGPGKAVHNNNALHCTFAKVQTFDFACDPNDQSRKMIAFCAKFQCKHLSICTLTWEPSNQLSVWKQFRKDKSNCMSTPAIWVACCLAFSKLQCAHWISCERQLKKSKKWKNSNKQMTIDTDSTALTIVAPSLWASVFVTIVQSMTQNHSRWQSHSHWHVLSAIVTFVTHACTSKWGTPVKLWGVTFPFFEVFFSMILQILNFSSLFWTLWCAERSRKVASKFHLWLERLSIWSQSQNNNFAHQTQALAADTQCKGCQPWCIVFLTLAVSHIHPCVTTKLTSLMLQIWLPFLQNVVLTFPLANVPLHNTLCGEQSQLKGALLACTLRISNASTTVEVFQMQCSSMTHPLLMPTSWFFVSWCFQRMESTKLRWQSIALEQNWQGFAGQTQHCCWTFCLFKSLSIPAMLSIQNQWLFGALGGSLIFVGPFWTVWVMSNWILQKSVVQRQQLSLQLLFPMFFVLIYCSAIVEAMPVFVDKTMDELASTTLHWCEATMLSSLRTNCLSTFEHNERNWWHCNAKKAGGVAMLQGGTESRSMCQIRTCNCFDRPFDTLSTTPTTPPQEKFNDSYCKH